jgi:RNA polymerase sigma-70 factor, ECF subfamily
MIGQSYSSARTPWSTDDSKCDESRKSESPEIETIRQAQQGDVAAFEHLYRLHSQRIYALCLRMVGNLTEAEDLTQEAFFKVFRKIKTFRGESAFSTWLHRLAVNVVLMHLRKRKLPGAPLEEMTRRDEENTGPAKEAGSPDLTLTGLVDRVNLERAVEQLPSAHKIVFVLHDVHGYKHYEIAEMMDLTVGTSKGRLHKAHTRLRELLIESHYDPAFVPRNSDQMDPYPCPS